MHDTLIINIPLNPVLCHGLGVNFTTHCDLHWFGLRTVGEIRYSENPTTGQMQTQIYDLKCPFDKLPSCYESMAFKFYHNATNHLPYVSLNASPKFLQGHNLYGDESIENLALFMLGTFATAYPKFFACLDVKNASISRVDITYSARLSNPDLMGELIDLIGVISVGQRKPDHSRNKYRTTRYWGRAGNRVGYCKMYGKADQIQEDVKSLNRKARLGNSQARELLKIFNDDLVNFSKGLLRFEATCKKQMLAEQGLPTNLWQFIRYQRFNFTNRALWQYWFNPIFGAMKGEILTNYDDTEILQMCKDKLFTITASGRVSYTRATNAYQFYCFLKEKGYNHAKSVMQPRTFQINIKSLCDLGLPKAHLQNLNGRAATSVPIAHLVNIDFYNQLPKGYQPITHQYAHAFDEFLEPALVA